MLKKWAGVFLLYALFWGVIIWMGKNGEKELERITHKEHELFALKVFDSEDGYEEIECWQNPYEGNYYLFLPSYMDEAKISFCVNSQDELSIGWEEVENGQEWGGIEFGEIYSMVLYREGELAASGDLTVLGPSGLDTLFINTESGNMEKIHQDQNYREKGTYFLISGDREERLEGKLSYIKGRGNSTWGWGKKPYRIRLEQGQDLLGMGEAESWELLANYQDGSFIRNKIVYDLADDIGLEYSPDSEFVDLYLNGYYAGLYQLAEKVEIGENRVHVWDLSKENEEINGFEKETKTFSTENEKGISWRVQPEEISGGYLLEWDIMERYQTADSGFVTEQGQAVIIKEPSAASEDEVAYIHRLVQEFEDALYSEDGKNPDTGKYFYEYIDLTSWAKKYLIEEVCKNFDGGISSQYFYKERNKDGEELLYAGPVWDYDGALGNGDRSIRNPEGMLMCYDIRIYDPQKGDRVFRNRWFPQLCKHDIFMEEVVRQYRNCVMPAVIEMIENGIDGYHIDIAEGVPMDRCRWWGEPINMQSIYRETLDEHMDYIKEFLEKRIDFLNKVWLDEVDFCTVCLWTEYGSRNFFYSVERGGTLERLPNYEESFNGLVFAGWYYDEAYTQPFDLEEKIDQDTDVYAKWIQE